MFTMMNETNNELMLNSELDMGIEIFPIYQQSLIGSLAPEFDVLYSEYTAKIIEKDNDLSKEYIRNQLGFLKGNVYTPLELNIKNYSVRPEPEFYAYLLRYHYSFRIGKENFNVPVLGVW